MPGFYDENKTSSCHIFPVRIKGCTEEMRAKVIEKIAEKNVSVNVHFVPLPMLTIFKNMGFNINNFPNAYQLFENEISLPIYPQLEIEDCKRICHTVLQAVEEIQKKL